MKKKIKNNKVLIFFFIQLTILSIGSLILAPLIPILADDFNIGLDLLGLTVSLNAAAIFIISIFSGFLTERFGKKTILIFASVLMILTFLGLFFARNYIFFTAMYSIFGFSWGLIYINSTAVISDIYVKNKTKALIMLNLGWVAGSIIAPLLISGALYIGIDWKFLFLFTAVINTLWLPFILSTKIKEYKNSVGESGIKNLFKVNKEIFLNQIVIFCALVIAVQWSVGNIFSTWFTTYFENLKISVQISSLLLSIYWISMGAGMFAKSYLISKYNERKVVLFFSIAALLSILSLFLFEGFIIKIISILFFGFSIAAIPSIVISIAIKQKPRYAGLITSILNSSGYLGIIFFQYATGYFLNSFSENFLIYISLFLLFFMIIFTSVLSFSKNE